MDFIEPDRHDDAECCIAEADMVRRRKWLRLLQEQQPRTAEFTVNGHDAGSRQHPPGAVDVQVEVHDADFAPGSNAGQIALIVFNVRGDLVLPLDQRRKIVGRRITRDRKFGARGHQSRYDSKNAEQSRCQHLKPEIRADESYRRFCANRCRKICWRWSTDGEKMAGPSIGKRVGRGVARFRRSTSTRGSIVSFHRAPSEPASWFMVADPAAAELPASGRPGRHASFEANRGSDRTIGRSPNSPESARNSTNTSTGPKTATSAPRWRQ